MNLVEYIHQNTTRIKGDSPHNELVRAILREPTIARLPDPHVLKPEVELRENGNPHLKGKPDIVAYHFLKGLYLVEVKIINNGDGSRNIKALNKQLQRGHDFFSKGFRLPSTCMGVYRHVEDDKVVVYRYPPGTRHMFDVYALPGITKKVWRKLT
jgi:hypothetical protein